MRKIFALILIALLLGVGVVAIIETDPGYLLLAFGDYTLESSLWVGLLLLVVFTLLIYALIALLRRLLGGQKSLAGWFGSRRVKQAARLSHRGVVNFIEGNWSKARRELLRGARNSEASLVNYLLAARASVLLGESDQAGQYLAAAADADARAGVAVELVRAEFQLQAGQYQQAINTLQDARRSPARYPRALALLRQAYSGLADWAGLAQLLPLLKKYGVVGADELQRLERETYTCLLQEAGDGARGASLDTLCDCWHKMPAHLRDDAAMIRRYAGLLVDMKGYPLAEKTILRALKSDWDPELVRLYGYVQSDNVRRQLAQAESWLQAQPNDAQLFLCLGRLAARDRLWGKSRDYFEKSYRLRHTPEVCAELGRLLLGLGEDKVAAAYFREGLLQAQPNLPMLPEPDKIVPNPRLLSRS